MIQNNKIPYLVLLVFACFLQTPTTQAETDTSVDSVVAMASSNQKNSGVTLEIAQLIYDAPLKSNKKNTLPSNRYFPSVQEMLDSKFFRTFIDQISESLYEERSYGIGSAATPEEMVTPTYFTLMGCDTCGPDHTITPENSVAHQVGESPSLSPNSPPLDNMSSSSTNSRL